MNDNYYVKYYEIEYFKKNYPHTFNRIVETGERDIKNFYISNRMRILRWGYKGIFWLMYITNSGKEVLITTMWGK